MSFSNIYKRRDESCIRLQFCCNPELPFMLRARPRWNGNVVGLAPPHSSLRKIMTWAWCCLVPFQADRLPRAANYLFDPAGMSAVEDRFPFIQSRSRKRSVYCQYLSPVRYCISIALNKRATKVWTRHKRLLSAWRWDDVNIARSIQAPNHTVME